MRRSDALEREVADTLRRLLGRQTRVLLAVSGGADSACLLWAATACAPLLGLHLEVAWIDHGLRSESAEEGRLVEEFAARKNVLFHTRAVEVGHAPGLEARARHLREQALEEIRAMQHLEAIATGHTASDQAETLLMRLARGSSLRGAAGVLARKGLFIRPLLGLTRGEVEAYLARQGVSFATDRMNADPAFLRVRIRTRVLPALETAAGPGVARRLARFAAVAEEDARLLDTLADAAWQRLQLVEGQLDAVGLRALEPPLQRRVMAQLLEGAGHEVNGVRLDAALRALARNRRTGLGGGWMLETAGGRVRLVSAASSPHTPSPTWTLYAPGDKAVGGAGGWQLGWSTKEPASGLLLPLPQGVVGPFQVRGRQPGDRMRRPDGNTRALQDVLVDARVPRELRDTLLLVLDREGRVLWVPGVVAGVTGSGGGWLWAVPAPDASGGASKRHAALWTGHYRNDPMPPDEWHREEGQNS